VKIAFYAPLKPPDHPVASGDREIARGLRSALTLAGHDVTLASQLRTFDRAGDAVRQARLCAIGRRVAGRLVRRLQRAAPPDLWFTYHLHHKAPDFLGPAVSRALAIPYVVAEASIAPRHRHGAWGAGYAHALAAIRCADTVVMLNPADMPEVRKARAPGAASAALAPFVDVARFAGARRTPPAWRAGDTTLRLITVAMMRDGAKLASYRLLADALTRIAHLRFELTIVGDGPARACVAAAFAALGERVTFAGVRTTDEIAALLAQSDLFVWPAVDEAIGIAFLEAQACGLPVVGADTPGVAAVIADTRTGLLAAPGDATSFAHAVQRLALDAPLRARMAAEAQAYVRAQHDLPVAAERLDAIVRDACGRRRRSTAAALPC